MRKAILVICAMFIFAASVNAESKKLEKEYRYKFYRENKVGEYIPIGEETKYEYEEEDNIEYGEYGEYTNSCDNDSKYDITKSIKYRYKEILPAQYIKITNKSNNAINIKKLNVYNHKTLVDYKINSSSNYDEDNNILKKNGIIFLYLPLSISLRQLSIELESDSIDSNYELLYSYGLNFYSDEVVARYNANTNISINKYNDNYTIYNNYTEVLDGYDIVLDDFIVVYSKEDVCKKRLIKTYHYNLEKIYIDDNYYSDVKKIEEVTDEDKFLYKKDLNNYKIFYKYEDEEDDEKELADKKEDKDEEENDEPIIKDMVNNDDNIVIDDIKLVNTGVDKKINYKYLILYVLGLILTGILLIKRIRKMSIENNS